jgi:hypothetical protein
LCCFGRLIKYLLDVAVKAGQVFPSHATIAKHAGCCERTVRNCLAWLRENGFLTWQRRLEWAHNELGQRMPRQISNAYTIALDGLAKIGAAVLNLGTTGKRFRVAQNPLTQLQVLVAQRQCAP